MARPTNYQISINYISANTHGLTQLWFNYNNLSFTANQGQGAALTSIAKPTRFRRTFEGIYILAGDAYSDKALALPGNESAATVALLATGVAGAISDGLYTTSGGNGYISAAAKWKKVSYTFNMRDNGQQGASMTHMDTGKSRVFMPVKEADDAEYSFSFYSDDLCKTALAAITMPQAVTTGASKRLMVCSGFWSQEGQSGGEQYVDFDGAPTQALESAYLANGKGVSLDGYARWTACRRVDLDLAGGSGPTTLWYCPESGHEGWYVKHSRYDLLQAAPVPVLSRKRFAGFFTGENGAGTKVIDADGSFLSAPAGDVTLHALWGTESYRVILDFDGDGDLDDDDGDYVVYGAPVGSGVTGLYHDDLLTRPITAQDPIPAASLPKSGQGPSSAAPRPNGFFSGAGGTGTQYISRKGIPTTAGAAATFSGKTVLHGGWTAGGGVRARIENAYDALDASNADVGIEDDADGVSSDGNVVSVIAGGFVAATEKLYHEAETGGSFYSDSEMREDVSSWPDLPVWPGREFLGFYGAKSNAATGTKYVNADGSFTTALTSHAFDAVSNIDIYARWASQSFFVIRLKNVLSMDEPDSDGDVLLYVRAASGSSAQTVSLPANTYTDAALATAFADIPVPSKTGYKFKGYCNTTDTGDPTFTAYLTQADGAANCTWQGTPTATSVKRSNFGEFAGGMFVFRDIRLYSRYVMAKGTLRFDLNGGTGSAPDRNITTGTAYGALPTATRARHVFKGWSVGGAFISATDLALVPSDGDTVTAYAIWGPDFMKHEDWFGFSSYPGLAVISSDEGSGRPRIVTRRYGKGTGADRASDVKWMNPTVRYMVVGDTNLAVKLGKAFPAQTGRTGYMITTVKVETSQKAFPIVTISGAANEGADAINLFSFSVAVLARARPQNLQGGVSPGNGELQHCSLTATCDPVVLAEGLAPCASDVIKGRMELHAETLAAANGSIAPSAAGGFTLLAAPKKTAGVDYVRYSMDATKEIA